MENWADDRSRLFTKEEYLPIKAKRKKKLNLINNKRNVELKSFKNHYLSHQHKVLVIWSFDKILHLVLYSPSNRKPVNLVL